MRRDRLEAGMLKGKSRTRQRFAGLCFAGLFAVVALIPLVVEIPGTGWLISVGALTVAAMFPLPALLLRDEQLERLGWWGDLIWALTLPIRLLLLVVGALLSLLG